MGIISSIKRWINMIFASKAREEFDVKTVTNSALEQFITMCGRIYEGNPDWLEDGVKTINFAKSICEETARLTMLATKITVDGSARAEWLQEQIDKVYSNLRTWVEYGCAYGTIILKPSTDGIDIVLPSDFIVTEAKGNKITGIVFINQEQTDGGLTYYTRLEYHRYIDGVYMVSNKCYKGKTQNDINEKVSIEDTPWAGMQEETGITDLEHPLYGVFKLPNANSIDVKSPLGVSIFANAVEELKDLDVAYSRNASEIYDSERIVLLDADKLIPAKGTANNEHVQENMRDRMKLPKFVRNVMGNGASDFYQEINPALNTAMRLTGIDAYLSQIGYKCGFSNGYFVFDQKTGMVTATQVEADDRRTIQTIKDVRDQLESCLDALFHALDEFASMYDLAPEGEYEVVYDFGDITYNYAEDKAAWWTYVVQGKVAFWRYLVKFEGMSEEEAKEISDEAQQSQMMQGLFNE